MLSLREKELQEAEKRLEQERNEFEFMQTTVQPIKIGIQYLAKKVLDVEVRKQCVCVYVCVCVCVWGGVTQLAMASGRRWTWLRPARSSG